MDVDVPLAGRLRNLLKRAALAGGLGPPVRSGRSVWRKTRSRLARRLAYPEDSVTRRDRLDNEHMRLLLSFTLRTDAHCIDVGAHEGAVVAEMVRLAPDGRHIAYEPLPHLHAKLVNRFPRVDVRCAALSDREEQTTFRWVKNMQGMSGLRERHYPAPPDVEIINVRTERLDDHLPQNFEPSFIKIDVEGAELLALKGMQATLERYHPLLVFEYGRGAEFGAYGTRPDDIHAFLTQLGYRIFDVDGNGPYTLSEFQTVTEYWNWVARP